MQLTGLRVICNRVRRAADAANHTGSSAVKFAVGYEYSLSKRTLVYLHYAHVSKPLSFIFVSNTNKAMIGIDHKF